MKCPHCGSENLVDDPCVSYYRGDGGRMLEDVNPGFACLDCGYSSHDEDQEPPEADFNDLTAEVPF